MKKVASLAAAAAIFFIAGFMAGTVVESKKHHALEAHLVPLNRMTYEHPR